MKILRLTKASYPRVLSLTERILKSGGVVIAPTDTVYGIMGDATKPAVIKKIFAMKGRPQEKALPIFVKDITTARKFAYIFDAKSEFLKKVWPGQVTGVFHHKEKLPRVLTGELDTIGVRVPNHPFLLELLAHLNFPLVQTSANISGKPPAKNIEDAKGCFGKLKTWPDLIIYGGELKGKPSTVVDFTGLKPLILRTGPLSRLELDEFLREMI